MSLIFAILIFIINSIGVIRYLNQWGDPLSTPTYSLVPVEYFLIWNILSFLLFAILILKFRKIKLLTISCMLFLAINVVLIGSQTVEPIILGTINSLVLNGVTFALLSSNSEWINIRHLDKVIEILTIFVIVFLIYQIFKFQIDGRLPAHSHEGLSVRFGSIYDDSLVLGIMLPFFAGYFLHKFKSTKSVIAIFALSLTLSILTGSLTCVAIMLFYFVFKARSKPKTLFMIFLVIFTVGVLFFEKLYELWIFKAGSIEAHLDGWNAINSVTLFSFLGFQPEGIYPEPGILALLLNFGIFVAIGIYGSMLYFLIRISSTLSKNLISRNFCPLFGATEALLISVFMASFNMPVLVYPPVFLMLAIFSGVVFSHLDEFKIRPMQSIA